MWCSTLLQVLTYGVSISEHCDSLGLVPGTEPPTVQSAHQLEHKLWPAILLPDPVNNGGWKTIVNNKTLTWPEKKVQLWTKSLRISVSLCCVGCFSTHISGKAINIKYSDGNWWMNRKQTVFCKMSAIPGKKLMWKINRLGVVESSGSPLTSGPCTKSTNPHTNNHSTTDLNMPVSCNTAQRLQQLSGPVDSDIEVFIAKFDYKNMETCPIASFL